MMTTPARGTAAFGVARLLTPLAAAVFAVGLLTPAGWAARTTSRPSRHTAPAPHFEHRGAVRVREARSTKGKGAPSAGKAGRKAKPSSRRGRSIKSQPWDDAPLVYQTRREPAHGARIHEQPRSFATAAARRAEVVPGPIRETSHAAAPIPPRTMASPGGAAAPFFASGVSHPEDDETRPALRAREASGSLEAAIGASVPVLTRSLPGNAAIATAQPPTPAVRNPVVSSSFGPEVDMAANGRPARRGGKSAPIVRPTPPPTSSLPVEERDAITEAAVTPIVLPALYGRNGRLLMPAPLKGSREVLVHQNTMADADGLERIQDENQLNELHAAGELVTLPASAALHINDELPMNRRAARPWTARFAEDISHNFYERFRQPLTVTSAARTVDFQVHLARSNGNAAGIEGDTASPHLTGQAIDIAKRGMSSLELAWMRAYLLPMMQGGLIDVEEEFQQSCFHISVYRRYMPTRRVHGPLRAESRPARNEAATGSLEEER